MTVFRRKNSHDSDVADFLDAVGRQELFEAKSIDVSCAAVTTPQEFPHSLGKPYRGVFVTGQSASVAVYPGLPTASTAPSKRFVLTLGAATACNVRVVVY